MKKIKKVKGVKSLSKILKKEVSSLESAGKHDNKLIGRGSIPLKVWLLTQLNLEYKSFLLFYLLMYRTFNKTQA
jgi:hypothetical protein